MTETQKKPFEVIVADNFHYGEEDEQYIQGEYATATEAVLACRRIVEESLCRLREPGVSAGNLYDKYIDFGDDPFIVGPNAPKFSAWTYAKEQCSIIIASEVTPKETG